MVTPVATPTIPLSVNRLLSRRWPLSSWLPVAVTVLAFGLLFASPVGRLVHDWLTDSDASYGLLLFPVALWLAWRAGVRSDNTADPRAGLVIILGAVLLRIVGSLAAEFFTQRFAIWLAALGLVVFWCGWRQVRHWWLPFAVLLLAIPLPALLINALAIPLQFQASKLGTAMITWRGIPVHTQGNVIMLGQKGHPVAMLFVAEACSGLRSLSALIALGVMLGGMYLRGGITRTLLLLSVIPVAVLLNGFRIFLTAFLVYFVDPNLATGTAHEGEGMVMFVAAFIVLAALTALVHFGESRLLRRKVAAHG